MDSRCFSVSAIEREKAWYLLTMLLRLGRPSSPEELASRCSLFNISPELVVYLCLIPDSPLCLTVDLFVTLSGAAFSVFGEFSLKVIPFLPRVTVRIPVNYGKKRSWDEVVQTYFRKRKGLNPSSHVIPTAKRRLLSHSEIEVKNDGELKMDETSGCYLGSSVGDGIHAVFPKVHTAVNLMSKDPCFVPYETMVMQDASGVLEQEGMPSVPLDCNAFLLHHGKDPIDTEKKSYYEEIKDGELSKFVQLPKYQCRVFNIEMDSVFNGERVRACDTEVEPAVLMSTIKMPVTQKDVKRVISSSQMIPEMAVKQIGSATTALRLEENLDDQSKFSQAENYQNGSGKLVCHWMSSADSKVDVPQTVSYGLETGNPRHASRSRAMLDVGVLDSQASHPERSRGIKDAGATEDSCCRKEQGPYDVCTSRGDQEMLEVTENIAQTGQLFKNDLLMSNKRHSNDIKASSLVNHEMALKMNISAEAPRVELSSSLKQPTKYVDDQKTMYRDTSTPDICIHLKPLYNNQLANSPKQLELRKRDDKGVSDKQKIKRGHNSNVRAKDNRADSTRKVPKNQLEPKMLPNFESFIVEEEEGSGGYGTVYRARRKHDGKTVAVKCPHANAHTHHVNNELKMLERFGGRNFIIKYEGSFRSGNSECFVLEHVEHDRPEVLKREIDIFELQWYGYCMFRALASLHKQGIVHRDVKPGNFLFSRKLNKGYLIDFNLALDLNHKYLASSKSKMNSDRTLGHSALLFSGIKEIPPKQADQMVNGRSLENFRSFKGPARDSKSSLEAKTMKRKPDAAHLRTSVDFCNRNKYRSTGADASGVTPTSTVTPSAERLKEPMPCQGRKELLNMVHEAMQGPLLEAVNSPSSQRKRVAAPLGKMDRKLLCLTPMPLHSSGIAIYGSGNLRTRGEGKPKKEGPCVGTKGFRAPEVLFKSPHQGPKVDVWSAGVTLLYLMTGRTPFVGDLEQNIKDIAKLRGSEDLWEVAKLHNRESSFPADLFDIQSLPSMELQEWCDANTRRLDILEHIPRSFFDLLDKCLTVNPRLRINAEEALGHEFFAPCHEALRKQRMLRQVLGSESGTSSLRSSSS